MIIIRILIARKGSFMRKSAIRLLLSAGLFATATAGAAQAQTAERYAGTLQAVWGDPRTGSAGGEIRFSLTLDDGRRFPLLVTPADQGRAIASFGKHVVIRGQQTTDAGGMRTIKAEHIDAAVGTPPVQHAAETRRVLYLLVKYQGDSQEPHSRRFYLDLTN